LVSCTKKIDATTEETYNQSLKSIKESLSGNEIEKLQIAFMIIGFNKVEFTDVLKGKVFDAESTMKSLHGMTYDDILNYAENIKQEKAEKEKSKAKSEIKELLLKKKEGESKVKFLDSVAVLKSKLYERTDFMREVGLELEVQNNSSKAISRIFFRGVVTSKGREIPWVSEEFNYIFSGGIEPKEKVKANLNVTFSGFANRDIPKNAIFTATVFKVYGANEILLADESPLSAYEIKRLEALLKDYPEFVK
jgi:hypothetical protein